MKYPSKGKGKKGGKPDVSKVGARKNYRMTGKSSYGGGVRKSGRGK